MKKSLVGYAGFSDNKIALHDDKDYYDGVLRIEIFKIRKEALKCYEDVRKVIIKEV